MTISIEHRTVYRYKAPVLLEPHIFRLRPRDHGGQRLLRFDLQISPLPAGSAECLDQDGNLTLNGWFNAPAAELSVRSRSTVELSRENPFDYLLAGEPLQLPLLYREPTAAALAPYRNDFGIAQPVKMFARAMAAEVEHDALRFLTALSAKIHADFRSVVRPTGAAWPADQTLSLREGSCRDLAMLFCDACRVMGFAARFVSGYESFASADASMHAWAEVYLPVVGWRGYDPSRGLAVSNRHVAVAAGFHPDLAAPVAGCYTGLPGAFMETSVVVA